MKIDACLTFDLDAEAAILTEGGQHARNAGVMSHQAYGLHVGVPRLLDLLREYALPATFFIPGVTAERYPGSIETILAAGHEVGHHSYAHFSPVGQTEAEERADFERALELLRRAGTDVEGYRCPSWEPAWRTPQIVAEHGLAYDSSLMDSDRPYVLDTGVGEIVELPVHWSLDDWEQYAYLPGLTGSGLIESPVKALEMWTLELEAMYRLGAAFVLTCHPFLSGRPSRAHALELLIERMKCLEGLWITTVAEVARHTASLNLPPRYCPPPVIPADAYWVARPPD